MRSCQALFGGKSCQELGDEYGYCHKHLRQERTLYNYYKSQECRWKEAKFEAQREHGHTDKFFQAHQYITTAICARRLHGKIFYPGDECSGHLQYILQLESEKFAVEWKVFEEGLGLVYQNEKIEEGLENALTKLDLECSDDLMAQLDKLTHDLPRVEVISDKTRKDAYFYAPFEEACWWLISESSEKSEWIIPNDWSLGEWS